MLKYFKLEYIIYQNVLLRKIINGKNFYDQPTHSDIKRHDKLNELQDKAKIIPQDIFRIINSSKIMIDL